MAGFTKEKALWIIVECAKQYKENLADRTLLFVCTDREKRIKLLEVSFDASNYHHLTGCKLSKQITAQDFFQRCLEHRLSVEDFELTSDGTVEMKLKVLPLLVKKNLSANSVGDYMAKNPKLYTEKLAGSVKGCMGFVKTSSGRYVPNTVLNIDMRKYIKSPLRIIATYSKKKHEQRYEELVYKAKKVELDRVVYPEEYKYLEKNI